MPKRKKKKAVSRSPQRFSYELDLHNIGYRPLYCHVGEKPLIVIFSMGFRSIVETSDWIRNNLGYKVLWISREVQGMRFERAQNILGADFPSTMKMLKMRKHNRQTVFVFVHMAAPHTAVWHMKSMVPDAKCVCFMYDCMNLWLPKEHFHLWDEFTAAKGSNIAEYLALEELLTGQYIEGIIHKDYGPSWPFLAKAQCPVDWMPSTLPEGLFQPQPRHLVPDRFVFIGTIMPRSTHDRPSQLFGDIFMNDVFRDVSKQGFEIHAYVMKPHEEVIAEYRKEFPPGSGVRLFNGALLSILLSRLAKRYKWGWMMYYYPQPLVMPLVEASLPTKLFTYLALGVPVVVSEEMKAVARLVKQEGCGVVVSKSQIQNLLPLLNSYDYEELLRNVLKTRKKFSLESHISTLGRVVEKAMSAERKKIPKAPEWLKLEEQYVQENESLRERGIRSSWVDSKRGYPSPEDREGGEFSFPQEHEATPPAPAAQGGG